MALTLAFLGLVLLMSRSYQIGADNLYGDLLCMMAALFYTLYLIAIGTLRERIPPMPLLELPTVAGAAVGFLVSLYDEARILPGRGGPLTILAVTRREVGQGWGRERGSSHGEIWGV